MSKVRQMLVRYESVSLRPYKDINGFTSIGIGRNLDTTGISLSEAYALLDNDIERCTIAAQKNIPCFGELTAARQDVIVMMIFQLGLSRTLEFHRFLSALAIGDYAEAANQIRNSLFAKQTPKRALDLAFLMQSGEYSPEAKA